MNTFYRCSSGYRTRSPVRYRLPTRTSTVVSRISHGTLVPEEWVCGVITTDVIGAEETLVGQSPVCVTVVLCRVPNFPFLSRVIPVPFSPPNS